MGNGSPIWRRPARNSQHSETAFADERASDDHAHEMASMDAKFQSSLA